MNGTYKLAAVTCGSAESTLLSTASLSSDISITVSYTGTQATRVTEVMGCVQTVPMSPIDFSSPGVMRVTEGQASCANVAPCAAISLADSCSTPASTADFPYETEGDLLRVTLPSFLPHQNPCGAGQATSPIVFTYRQVR